MVRISRALSAECLSQICIGDVPLNFPSVSVERGEHIRPLRERGFCVSPVVENGEPPSILGIRAASPMHVVPR